MSLRGPSTGIDRRRLFAGALAPTAGAAAQPARESLDLWPGEAPGGPPPRVVEDVGRHGAISGVTRPRLTLFRPRAPNGAAVVVAAGGGYRRIEAAHESTPACVWLQSLGVTAFELVYRLPGDGWPPEAALADAQRAMRLVRGRAGTFGLDPARIGILGFSAGGHLAGMTATRPDRLGPPAGDAIDAASARPDFAGLIYPVINMLPPLDATQSARQMLAKDGSDAARVAMSVDRQVDRATPPTFLAQAADDPIAAVDNSMLMFAALRRAGVAAELHVFQTGRHGWGLGACDSEVRAWPDLFASWMGASGFIRDPIQTSTTMIDRCGSQDRPKGPL